jgi:trehalose utilization protein
MPVGACDCSIRPSIDSALKAQGEPVAEICSDGEPLLYAGKRRPEGTKLYTAPPADDRPTWDEVRRMLVLAVDWGYDEGFAYANDGCAQAVPIDEKCDRIITEFRKEKEK